MERHHRAHWRMVHCAASVPPVEGNYAWPAVSPLPMLIARGLAPVRARTPQVSVRALSTVPFRGTMPTHIRHTQPTEMTIPVLVGCGLIGAYVCI